MLTSLNACPLAFNWPFKYALNFIVKIYFNRKLAVGNKQQALAYNESGDEQLQKTHRPQSLP